MAIVFTFKSCVVEFFDGWQILNWILYKEYRTDVHLLKYRINTHSLYITKNTISPQYGRLKYNFVYLSRPANLGFRVPWCWPQVLYISGTHWGHLYSPRAGWTCTCWTSVLVWAAWCYTHILGIVILNITQV